ncbi:MAG: class I SAM-dependent methyltransferase, partial [Thermomicrobiales bacterium]
RFHLGVSHGLVPTFQGIIPGSSRLCYDARMDRGQRPLPTAWPRDALQIALDERAPWFYAMQFTNGARTDGESPPTEVLHRTRFDAIFPHLDRLFSGHWPSITCLDIACHEGWFSFQTAVRGAAMVHGVDIRPEYVARARWLAEVTGLSNTRFDEADLFNLPRFEGETFDLVYFVGIIYHLEDPMRALRIARSLTGHVCVIEGTVARAQQMDAMWGPMDDPRRGPGAIVLPADEKHTGVQGGITLVPSLDGLRLMLLRAGFRAVHLVLPTEHDHPVYGTYDRVIVFAYI